MTRPGHSPTVVIYGWPEDPDQQWLSECQRALPDGWNLCAPAQWAGLTLDCPDQPAAILAALETENGGPIGLVRFGTMLPDHCWERLARSLAESNGAGVVSPLSNAHPDQAPVPGGCSLAQPDVEEIDRLAYLYSQRRVWPSDWISPLVSFWSRQAVGQMPGTLDWEGILAWQLSRGFGPAVCDHCYVQAPGRPLTGPVPADPRDRPAASFLEHLRMRMAATLDHGGARLPPVALDQRPVVLHILHSWGGGISQWVEDLACAQSDRHHLFLCAWANPGSSSHGQELRLFAGSLDSSPIASWVLPRPIASTVRHDEFYQQVLHHVIADFAVDGIMVSSLIGHSLDCVTTRLPTTVVFHDYYPAWPALQIAFESHPEAPFDGDQLQAELDHGIRFVDKDPNGWFELRMHYLEELSRANVRCAAPSVSVIRNLEYLDSRFQSLNAQVIPHGMRPLPEHDFQYQAPAPGERLRLVTLGRMTAGKGKNLLLDGLDRITEKADLYLVGAGKDAEDFFGRSHVHLILDYQRDELPELMRSLRPHLALLLSAVSETFSYTLSETRAMGIPVAATRMGAFPDRIVHGETGWLIDVSADALADLVAELADEPSQLKQVAHTIAGETVPGLDSMGQAYRELMALPPGNPARYRCHRPRIADARLETLSRTSVDRDRQIGALEQQVAEQIRELERRDHWGRKLERRLARRTRWAEELESEVNQTRDALMKLQVEFEERTRWALDLTRDVEQRDEHIRTLAEHAGTLEERLERKLAELDLVVNSRSWQLTRPLRFAARKARALMERLGFQTRRAATLAQRTQTSIKVRGVSGTVERIRKELNKPTELDTEVPMLPETLEPPSIPSSDVPRVSIIIPVYNQYEHTRGCLQSIAEADTGVPYEVIVVDDASNDETEQELARCQGIQVLRNEENAGFIRTCNRGADAARGEFLVFLNNDTAVGNRWLDHLLETFDRHPDAGLVGAKLVYPDGRLQEAGGVVFADASGWNYGRFEDRNAPEFNYVREVDYCSGACAMIPRELFDQLGQFDLRYVPAYYEDTDLAFAVRQAGKKAYYQPLSVVTHFEGVTSGTDLESGTKKYQTINQAKFLEKWADALEQQPAAGTPIELARRHRSSGSVLIVDACTPTPDQDSGSLRMVNLMTLFRDLGWHVRFLPDNRCYEEGYTRDLQQLGVEALYQPFVNVPQAYLEKVGESIDVVILSRHYVARNYIEMMRRYCPNAKLIFDTVDLHYLREQRLAELEQSADLLNTARKTRAQELDVARRCDLTLVVSEYEVGFLAEDAPELEVAVLSNIHQVYGRRREYGQRRDLMFVGGFQHPPNIDAVKWFVSDILPLVRTELPDVVFHVIGSKATPEVKKLGKVDGVEFHGFVKDIEPFLDGCRLAVAPLRYGAGVKGKVNMSMSYGQPVVASPAAVEGMHVSIGEDVLVGQSSREFADAIIRAYQDETLWTTLSDGGLQNVESHFSFNAARRALEGIVSMGASAWGHVSMGSE